MTEKGKLKIADVIKKYVKAAVAEGRNSNSTTMRRLEEAEEELEKTILYLKWEPEK